MEAKKKIVACYDRGAYAAFVKFALAPTTPADSFIANVDQGKDMPLDPTTDAHPDMGVSESADAMPLPEDPAMAQGQAVGGMPTSGAPVGLGEMAAKSAMDLKGMNWIRNTLGEDVGTNFLAKHDMRTHTGVPQDFRPMAPVATARPAAAPTPTPGPSSKVIVHPSLKTSVRPRV